MTLQTIWFVLFFVLIAGYALLDGFDLGVGMLSLFSRNDQEKRIHYNSIGPVWDGNEVWLLTGGGALFAAFPVVYASVFSGFYIALMLLLLALILRAVSFEFRGKMEHAGWRKVWDLAFGIGSFLPALLFGVAVGNILRGISLDAQGNYTGTFFDLLNPFALVVGLLSVAMFWTHGALYLSMKSEGELARRSAYRAGFGWLVWLVLYVAATVTATQVSPFLFQGLLDHPLFWVFLVPTLAAWPAIPLLLKKQAVGRAFIASSVLIVCSIALAALSLHPTLVPALGAPELSLTIHNASSTPRTLTTMLVIALVGMPVVIGYTIVIYRFFKGKVRLDEYSY